MSLYVSQLTRERVRTSQTGEYLRTVRDVIRTQVPLLDNAVGAYILEKVCRMRVQCAFLGSKEVFCFFSSGVCVCVGGMCVCVCFGARAGEGGGPYKA